MKTRLIFPVLLIACLSCMTNIKPVSDAEKEKIIGEVKEAVATLIKGAEEANFNMVVDLVYDSPDFVAFFNGNRLPILNLLNGQVHIWIFGKSKKYNY